MKGTLKAFCDGKMISELTECDVDVYGDVLTDEEKTEFTLPSTYDSGGVTMCYIPIDPTAATDNISSNIAQYNATEKFTKTKDMKLILSRYPHLDCDIISSNRFDFADGAFFLKWKYSVVYEPIAIYVNGIKARNITKYREDRTSKPTFTPSYRDDDYQYYVENGNVVVFNKSLLGTILVYYYKTVDAVQIGVEMYRSNYNRDDMSPEIYSYTLLANIQR